MIVLISNGFLFIQNDAICSVRNSYTVAKRLHLANKKPDFSVSQRFRFDIHVQFYQKTSSFFFYYFLKSLPKIVLVSPQDEQL